MDQKRYNRLDPFLQQVLSSKVCLDVDERKVYNQQLRNLLGENLIPKMKEVDPAFNQLYSKVTYTGSYYENLRVGTPDEFDLNLVLKLPAESFDLHECQPGFLKVHTTNWGQKEGLEKVQSWRDSEGYIQRDSVLRWLQSVVDKAIKKLGKPGCEVRRSMNGPAVTASVTYSGKRFSVDLVPCFVFGKDKWPQPPARQAPSPYHQEGWCVVPKASHHTPEDGRVWRMSFYHQEKSVLNKSDNVKAVLKLIKLLRDRQGWHNLVSYHIKTVFMWEISSDSSLSGKGLGVLLMHMLEKLEGHMRRKTIPFYWDDRHNLISNMSTIESTNICNRIAALLRNIEKKVDDDPQWVKSLFMQTITHAQAQMNSSFSGPREAESQEQDQRQAEGVQWDLLAGLGAVVIGGALILGALIRQRDNN